jgi:RNA polymerase sigma factor (TIGR02999 family)
MAALLVKMHCPGKTGSPALPKFGFPVSMALGGDAVTQITQLLQRMHAGDAGAREELFANAYGELRRLAHARLRDGGRGTVLQTTSLINESYLRYVTAGELRAGDRRAFFAFASRVMRSVILEEVRSRMAQMRGGGVVQLTLDTELAGGLPADGEEILKVHDALLELEAINPRLAHIVQMRYFGGYTEQEIAETLGVTDRTVRSDWERARLILAEALR